MLLELAFGAIPGVASLCEGPTVPAKFMPWEPGEHEFAREMGMLGGAIIVE